MIILIIFNLKIKNKKNEKMFFLYYEKRLKMFNEKNLKELSKINEIEDLKIIFNNLKKRDNIDKNEFYQSLLYFIIFGLNMDINLIPKKFIIADSTKKINFNLIKFIESIIKILNQQMSIF